jgi:hypothetical protein
MSDCLPLRLEFSDEVPCKIRARMSYAFRVFAAVYGHEVLDEDRDEGSLRCIYGSRPKESRDSKVFQIPARYVLRRPQDPPSPPVRCSYAEEEFYLFHGRDEAFGSPDWLGEIFEWLSSADEMSITERDSIGRIPYAQSLFARYSISPLRPHASLIMAWFQNALTNQEGPEDLPAAPSPVPGISHLVICSHDIDFYFDGRWGSLTRLLKNMGIALLIMRSYPFFRDNLYQLFRLVRGRRVGDFLPQLLRACQEHDFVSTFFVIARRQHRRDANYVLEKIAPPLQEALKKGCCTGLHGSYQSVVENCDLKSEVGALEAGIGEKPRGNRQHWLRFDRHEKLFRKIEEAGLLYDSTLGFSNTVGFRNGASFAFPPYSFEREEPYRFLEIPLAVMDGALIPASQSSVEQAAKLTATVLQESRRWGWGGIALLWHNPFEPLGVPEGINRIFWEQMKTRAQHQERWISAEEFLALSLARYQRAGLLKGVEAVAQAANC